LPSVDSRFAASSAGTSDSCATRNPTRSDGKSFFVNELM
jgi:hypothetical protein